MLVDFGRGFSGAEHLLGHDQPFLDDITVDGAAHQSLEFPGQVVFTDKEPVCQFVQAEIFVIVLIDITQDIVYRGILGRDCLCISLLQSQPVQHHQDLGQIAHGCDFLIRFFGTAFGDQLFQLEVQKLPLNALRPQLDVKVGDIIEIAFGQKSVKIRVLDIQDTSKKDEAKELFEYI